MGRRKKIKTETNIANIPSSNNIVGADVYGGLEGQKSSLLASFGGQPFSSEIEKYLDSFVDPLKKGFATKYCELLLSKDKKPLVSALKVFPIPQSTVSRIAIEITRLALKYGLESGNK